MINELRPGELMLSGLSFCSNWNADIRQQYLVKFSVEVICRATIRSLPPEINSSFTILIPQTADSEETFTLYLRNNADAFDPFDPKNWSLCSANTEETNGDASSIANPLGDLLHFNYVDDPNFSCS